MGAVIALAGGVAVLLGATVVFDVVHVALHRLEGARAPWLRALGAAHAVHHRFLGPDLVVDPGLVRANVRWHVLPEYATHVGVTTGLLLVLPPAPVLVALAMETMVVLTILRDRGLDVNHRGRTRVPAYRPGILCVPAYHALHHVRPAGFYSSWIKVVDAMLGTTVALRGRSAAVVGAPGPARDAMARALSAETGESVVVLAPPAVPDAVGVVAREADILVLMPPAGTPEAIVSEWIETATSVATDRLVPIEVWAVFEDTATFAAEGRGYVDDARVIYRHVVAPRRRGADPDRTARAVLARVHRGTHRIHTGSCGARVRARALAWRGVRPVRRGPRAGALA
ncbi:MAG TPA: sterol desaturase family protein [Actinomycetota bacterium]